MSGKEELKFVDITQKKGHSMVCKSMNSITNHMIKFFSVSHMLWKLPLNLAATVFQEALKNYEQGIRCVQYL